jgi:hypothetical protein
VTAFSTFSHPALRGFFAADQHRVGPGLFFLFFVGAVVFLGDDRLNFFSILWAYPGLEGEFFVFEKLKL